MKTFEDDGRHPDAWGWQSPPDDRLLARRRSHVEQLIESLDSEHHRFLRELHENGV